jgi:hypothetical protein
MWIAKRTRLFLVVAGGILVVGLGTGLLASYMGLQNFIAIGGDGPAELSYIPSDARVVAFANVREVMDSDLRQKLLTSGSPSPSDPQGKLFEATGIDIETDIDQIVASLSGGGENVEHPIVLARGRFDTSRIETFDRQEGGRAEDYQGKRLLTLREDGHDLSVGFVEPGLVALGSAAGVRRAIDTKTSGADVKGNDELMRILRDVDDGNAWTVARFDAITGRARLPQEIASQLPPISWFAASGYINGGVRGLISAETRDDAAAQDLRQVLQGFIALARMQTQQHAEFNELISSLQLGGVGKTVSLGFSVPPEVIGALGAMGARRPRPAPEADPVPQPARPRRPAPPSL